MLRQAVRKAPRKIVRSHVSRVNKTRKIDKEAGSLSSSSAIATPIFIPRIKQFINNLGTFVAQRKKDFTTSDPIYKRLNTIHTSLVRETKKKNILNPNTAKNLKKLTPALRGVTKLPANVKGQVGKLAIFVRREVNKDVLALMKKFKGMIAPMQTELNKLEIQLQAHIKKTRNNNIQLKIDPSIKKRFNAINTNFNRYRTKWYKRLETIHTHGNRQVQAQVKSLKKQIDDLQKSLKRNMTIVNRYAKSVKPRKGFKTELMMNANHVKILESKWKNIDTECEKFRIKVEHIWDHLKAVKLF